VIAAVDKWAAGLDKSDKDYEHHMTEALWVHQWHNVVDVDLLKKQLRSPDYHARFAATRVLCYWRDRVPGAVDLLKVQAGDENPRVRLEAIRACSFFNGNDVRPAFLAATEALKYPLDYYLNYTFKETVKQLQSISKDAVMMPNDPHALAYILSQMSDRDLLKAPDSEGVFLARVERRSLDINDRFKAIQGLAALHKSTPEAEFGATLKYLDEKGPAGGGAAEDLGKALGSLDSDVLAKSRASLLTEAQTAAQHGVRRIAWAAVLTADNNPATTWADARNDSTREALVDSIGVLYDPGLREQFQPILAGALADPKTPAGIRSAALRSLALMGPTNAKANFAIVAKFIEDGTDRVDAARAMMQLPRDSWDKSAAGPIAQSILAWARTVPEKSRTSQDYIETSQAASEIAGLLPPAEGTPIRKELRGLGVSVFVIKTVREQMRYDTTRLVVEVGKPFEVIMENLDFMPHNICFVEPGQRQSVATSVEKMRPDQLDKQGRAYMPAKDKGILGASKLVEPGDKVTIQLKGINRPGEYEFVCTFPGHWQMMYGTLIVTKDVDAYLAAHPAAPEQPKMDMKNMKH
jgi:azurin